MAEGEKLEIRLADKVDGMFDELLKELAAEGRYESAGNLQVLAMRVSNYLRSLASRSN